MLHTLIKLSKYISIVLIVFVLFAFDARSRYGLSMMERMAISIGFAVILFLVTRFAQQSSKNKTRTQSFNFLLVGIILLTGSYIFFQQKTEISGITCSCANRLWIQEVPLYNTLTFLREPLQCADICKESTRQEPRPSFKILAEMGSLCLALGFYFGIISLLENKYGNRKKTI